MNRIRTIKQFIKFGIVGFSNTIVSYVVYFSLVYLGFHYLIGNIFAFFIGVLNSFFWNNKYVFRNEKNNKHNMIHSLIKTYIAYAFSGLVIGNLLLFIFIDIMYISKYIAPFCGLIITVPLNFILNKFWVFKPIQEKKDIVGDIYNAVHLSSDDSSKVN